MVNKITRQKKGICIGKVLLWSVLTGGGGGGGGEEEA